MAKPVAFAAMISDSALVKTTNRSGTASEDSIGVGVFATGDCLTLHGVCDSPLVGRLRQATFRNIVLTLKELSANRLGTACLILDSLRKWMLAVDIKFIAVVKSLKESQRRKTCALVVTVDRRITQDEIP